MLTKKFRLGELDEIIDGLVLFDQTQKLEELNGPKI